MSSTLLAGRGGALLSILPTGVDVSNESMAVVELPEATSIDDRSASLFLSSLFLDSNASLYALCLWPPLGRGSKGRLAGPRAASKKEALAGRVETRH